MRAARRREAASRPATTCPLPPLPAGYRAARLAGNGLRTCTAVVHPFNSATPDSAPCDTTDRRVLALETTFDCRVRLSVLGDPGCSVATQLAVVEG